VRAEPERVELATRDACARDVDLVDEQRDRLVRPPQRARDRLVLGQRRSGRRSEDDRVGIADRGLRLRLDRRRQACSASGSSPAVSTTSTRRPETSISSAMRSRVMPGGRRRAPAARHRSC
jgi:hypothetical protein